MALPVLLAPVVGFLLREIVVKFVVFSALFAVLAYLVPKMISYLGPFLGVSSLASAFGSISPGVWFWLDFFQLGYGVPLLISAFVTRFLIRRLPVIG